jgi:hypothetical protein
MVNPLGSIPIARSTFRWLTFAGLLGGAPRHPLIPSSRRYGAAKPHSRDLRENPLSDIMYRNCDARELFMSSAKSRTIPPLRVSEELRADAESVLAPGETLSAFVMDAVSRTIDFRKSQLDFLARGIASAERARAEGDYVPADKVIAGLRRRLANAQRVRK